MSDPIVRLDQRHHAMNEEGTIAVAWWIRDDAGEWEPWMTNTFTRIS